MLKHRMSHGIIVSYEETNETLSVEEIKSLLEEYVSKDVCRITKSLKATKTCNCLYCRTNRALNA